MSNMSFDVEVATRIGLYETILLENIYFWVRKNQENEKSIFDGKAWTYNSIKAFAKLFPFMTEKIIRNKLNWLVENDYLKAGNYNKSSYDRTKWYTVTEKGKMLLTNKEIPNAEKENPFAQKANGSCEKGEPIPDIKPDINTDIKPNIAATTTRAREGKGKWENFAKPHEEELGKIIKLYSDNIHPVTPLEGEQLTDMLADYGYVWLEKAIKRAVERGKRTLGYIKGILGSWQTNGFDGGDHHGRIKQNKISGMGRGAPEEGRIIKSYTVDDETLKRLRAEQHQRKRS